VRRRLKGSDDGDRQMVKSLSAVLSDGLAAVEAACAEALAGGVHSAYVVLNILARRRDPGRPATIATPEVLSLRHASATDRRRSGSLLTRCWREVDSKFRFRTTLGGLARLRDARSGQSTACPLLRNHWFARLCAGGNGFELSVPGR
jgi:hypothetical protein